MMRKTICRIFTGTAMLAWMILIFFFSAQPAEDSGRVSGTLTYRIVALADNVLDLELSEQQKEIYVKRLHHPLRKAAHMTEFALLFLLCFAFFRSMAIRGKRLFLFSFGFTAIYALFDEFHQLFVAGRSCSFWDVLIDASGAGIAMLLAGLIFWLCRRPWDRTK